MSFSSAAPRRRKAPLGNPLFRCRWVLLGLRHEDKDRKEVFAVLLRKLTLGKGEKGVRIALEGSSQGESSVPIFSIVI